MATCRDRCDGGARSAPGSGMWANLLWNLSESYILARRGENLLGSRALTGFRQLPGKGQYMKRLTVRRLAPPVLAGVVTSIVVAAIAVGAGPPAGAPTPTGQAAGQLVIDGKIDPDSQLLDWRVESQLARSGRRRWGGQGQFLLA